MGITDPEAALEKVREFCDLIRADLRDREEERTRSSLRRLYQMQPLMEAIAREIDEDNVALLAEKSSFNEWPIGDTQVEAVRLIGILEQQEDFQQIFGPAGPTLAASGLHPWVWNAAASLWDDGHYEPAAHEAAKAVELRTQLKVDRRDLDGKDLYAHAFSTKDPKPEEPRLRFPNIDRAEQPKRWTSAHEGARNLGMGCAQGIRNPQAHPSPDITEQEALEQLAALSVLARWVDECDVDRADGDAAGE